MLDPSFSDRDERLISICSWCNKIRIPEWALTNKKGEWVEADVAIKILQLFNSPHLPGLTHGICETCNTNLMMETDDLT
jgi:hypothetical protein